MITEQALQLPEIPTVLKKILCNYAGYYDGVLNRFEVNSKGELTLSPVIGNKSDIKLPLLIVSRSFYSEQARNYPIENKKDLKKLLNIEFLSPEKTEKIFFHAWSNTKHISEKSNTQSAVNIWQFANTVPAAYLTLPESLLLAIITKTNQVLTLNLNKPSYVARVNQLVHSLNQTTVVNTTQRFAMSTGVAELVPTQVVNPQSLPSMLALGLKKLPLSIIASFIKLPKVEGRFELIKKITLPALAVLTVYLAGTSGYLTYKKYDLQQQLSAQRGDVSTALLQQVDFDNNVEHYKQLQKFNTTQKNSTPFWLVMVELFPSAQFTNIRIDNERFVLRGSTNKATTLLENLTKSKQVSDAKFDFPVRKYRGKETFVISFKLIERNKFKKIAEQKNKPYSTLVASRGTYGGA